MDIWSWICELPNSVEWTESDSPFMFELASEEKDNSARSIHLKAERTSGSDSEAVVTFTVCLQGIHIHIPILCLHANISFTTTCQYFIHIPNVATFHFNPCQYFIYIYVPNLHGHVGSILF